MAAKAQTRTRESEPAATTNHYRVEGSDYWMVERILGAHRYSGKLYFLVKWLGYPTSCNSWEPISSFLERELIQNFEKEHGLPTQPDEMKMTREGKAWHQKNPDALRP